MAHKLKITLNQTEPKIYRTVIVPETFNFEQLHNVIQCVMSWDNSHLYQFNVGAPYRSDFIKLKEFDDMADDFFMNRYQEFDAIKTKLSDFFNGKTKKMIYIYDFGDDWIHTITVLKKPDEEVLVPKCIKGENAAPIDDMGGIWGFDELLEIIAKKRKTADDKEHLEWAGIPNGKTYDELYGFDIEDVNVILLEEFST